MIYGFWNERTCLLKIGRSDNPARRLAQLETGTGPLRNVATFEGDEGEERSAHRRFGHRRVHGEWFRVTQREWVEYCECRAFVIKAEQQGRFVFADAPADVIPMPQPIVFSVIVQADRRAA